MNSCPMHVGIKTTCSLQHDQQACRVMNQTSCSAKQLFMFSDVLHAQELEKCQAVSAFSLFMYL